MKKKIVYSFRGEEGLIPEGVNTSKYLQTCVNAYISHSLFDEAVDQWNYVFKGLQVPKGIEVADYIRHAVKTFQQDYHLVMEDGNPVFYKGKPEQEHRLLNRLLGKNKAGKDEQHG